MLNSAKVLPQNVEGGRSDLRGERVEEVEETSGDDDDVVQTEQHGYTDAANTDTPQHGVDLRPAVHGSWRGGG